MTRYVVDTNVPIVANGRPDPEESNPPSISCRTAAVEFLMLFLRSGTILLDASGEIQAEYRKYLNARGQPGVGDRFYQEVLNSSPSTIERINLPVREDGEYVDLPDEILASTFDRSDRKFAALARREAVPVVNATDSDWLNHVQLLRQHAIDVKFVCGCQKDNWFSL